jgi:hypothetical protein
MDYKLILSGIGLAAILLASMYFLSTVSAQDNKEQLNDQESVAQTSENDQYFQQKAQAAGDVCGDLTSNANIQHLSHHPDRYTDCLTKVDPALLKQATGKTLGEILGE